MNEISVFSFFAIRSSQTAVAVNSSEKKLLSELQFVSFFPKESFQEMGDKNKTNSKEFTEKCQSGEIATQFSSSLISTYKT